MLVLFELEVAGVRFGWKLLSFIVSFKLPDVVFVIDGVNVWMIGLLCSENVFLIVVKVAGYFEVFLISIRDKNN